MRLGWVVVGVVAVSLWAASSAAAALPKCGATDPKTGTTARAALTLDEAQAVTDKLFKRDTGRKTLVLVFKVNGCELESDVPAPSLDVLPRTGDLDELDDPAAVSIKSVTPEPASLDVALEVNSDKFDPGSYGAVAVLRAPYIATARTPIAVSRSESSFVWPAVFGIAAGLGGFFIITLGQLGKGYTLKQGKAWLAVVIALTAAVVGAIFAVISYTDQDVWVAGQNWKSAAAAGFTGATTGVMAGLLAGMWDPPPPGGG
jgi:hypothetical protein